MSEIADLLRMQTQCDKEFVVTPVTVTDVAAPFTSRLSGDYVRKAFFAYNNSDAASGELYYGSGEVTEHTGRPIPLGADVEFFVSPALNVYFVAASGEIGDLRVFEGA